jgi:GT2 family glycosyltransferase
VQKITDLFRDHHVIIADNSVCQSYQSLPKPKHCTIIPLETNIGYGAGANKGLAYAFTHGARNVVVINQDVSFTIRSVQALQNVCKAQQSGVSGPVLGWIDPVHYSTDLTFRRQELSYVSGSCMVISRDVFDIIGGFNTSYFMYYEDADMSMRVQMSGFMIKKFSVPGFRHDEKTGKKDPEKEYYLSRNHLKFMMAFAPFSVRMREFLRIPFRMIRYSKNKNVFALHGVADFLFGINGKMRER